MTKYVVPLVDLKPQYLSIRDEIHEAITRVLESGRFVLGHEVQAFEEEFAAYCGSHYAVAVNSGTSALHLALLAAGIAEGDEVITIPFTFVATVAAICYTGARPVFVDIDPDSYTMDVSQIENVITERTKAILPVHLYGHPADMDPILNIARRYGLIVVEDAAQAHGAKYKDRRVGSIGDLGCFSFYPSKNLGAYGEGGMVLTNNAEFAETIGMLRNCGQERKYYHVLLGYNYRMDELQAAILRVKLKHLEKWIEGRRRRAALYNEMLTEAAVESPKEIPYARHVYHIYAIRSPHRDALQQFLDNQGIETGIHYPLPIHLQDPFAHLGYKPGNFPCSEQAAKQVLSLPIYPELGELAVRNIAQCIRASSVTLAGE